MALRWMLAGPLVYGGAIYLLFYWLNVRASDEAKAVLSELLTKRTYNKEQVAYVLIELFDLLYTKPLLAWRALLRSALISVVVTTFWGLKWGVFFPLTLYLILEPIQLQSRNPVYLLSCTTRQPSASPLPPITFHFLPLGNAW
jgi:hypothetical protein